MDLQIYISKKGTKVVRATGLHLALELKNEHYASNVKKWLTDVYSFSDDIRKPIRMKDYAPVKKDSRPNIIEDYYLSLEFARLITLISKSKNKLKYSRWFKSVEKEDEVLDRFSPEQVLSAMELAKAMSLMSCQESCERQHLKMYESRNEGQASNWWTYRAQVLGYDSTQLRNRFEFLGHNAKGKNIRQMLYVVDKYETIRTGVIDLYMAMGKGVAYARNMGNLVKKIAKQMKLEVADDRKSRNLFSTTVNPELINELNTYSAGTDLNVLTLVGKAAS